MAVSFIGVGNWHTGENHRPVASHWQTLSHNVLSSKPRHKQGLNSRPQRPPISIGIFYTWNSTLLNLYLFYLQIDVF
jgi:hypothetical protein